MLKSIVFIIGYSIAICSVSLAETIEAKYNVSYGILGQIGTAKALLKKDQQTYNIDIHLKATGLAKVLSRGRKERHISKGHIENGLMISDLYQVIKSQGNTVHNKEYWADHKKKRIIKKYKKYKNGKLVSQEESVLEFYAKDDLLTLYFNLNASVKEKHKPRTYVFKAVGAERQKGKVSMIIPKKDDLPKYIEALGTDSAWYATAIIHQKVFSSKEGRLLLGVAEDGIVNKTVLKDVIFFGDITGVRIK